MIDRPTRDPNIDDIRARLMWAEESIIDLIDAIEVLREEASRTQGLGQTPPAFAAEIDSIILKITESRPPSRE
jgi:hypothetical protein